MNVYLNLQCDDRFAAKAQYVFSTFCKVLGLDLIVESDIASLPRDNRWVISYGAATNRPGIPTSQLRIVAAPEAADFYMGNNPCLVDDVRLVHWGDREVPFLFRPAADDDPVKPLEHYLDQRAGTLEMPYDFVASAFYFLACWDEITLPMRDQHGRFQFAHSLAAQLNLQENIVDIYLDLFIHLLNVVSSERQPRMEIPNWQSGEPFVVCLTHDVDEIRKSHLSRLKFLWDHLVHPEPGHRDTPVQERARFALNTLFERDDPYWTFPNLAEMEKCRDFTASYFFQSGGRNGRNSYSLQDPQVRDFIIDLLRSGFEVGLHGSYYSGFDEEMFTKEMSALEEIVEVKPIGHRQHYLRMEYSTAFSIYERSGLYYDATLGFAEMDGYRNQFSYPYFPYNHLADRAYWFLEFPTVIMDATLNGYRELTAEEGWQVTEMWLERAYVRKACLTLLWHNPWDGFMPGYFDMYPKILDWIDDHDGKGLAGRDVYEQWLSR